MVLCMHILEISSLHYSETFDANVNVSKITSLSFCCKYRTITMQTKALLLTEHCKKSCPQVKNKPQNKPTNKKNTHQNLRQVLIICTFK